MANVLVINPNSNPTVTLGIDEALTPLRSQEHNIRVINLEGTPFGIQSQSDVDSVAMPTAERIRQENPNYDAFVIACFSDPGLYVSRELSAKPVFGIAQSGMLTALALGQAVGVISILSTSIARHWRFYRALGLANMVVGDVAIDTPVAELADEDRVFQRMLNAGQQLKEKHGADVLVMGCAGMARYRAPLEADLGLAVVDPTQAATGMALAAVPLGYGTR